MITSKILCILFVIKDDYKNISKLLRFENVSLFLAIYKTICNFRLYNKIIENVNIDSLT